MFLQHVVVIFFYVLCLQDDVEFRTGKLVSFAPGQQVTPRIDSLQINQVRISCLMEYFVWFFRHV